MTGNNDFYIREGVDLNVQHAKVYFFTKEIEKQYLNCLKNAQKWLEIENKWNFKFHFSDYFLNKYDFGAKFRLGRVDLLFLKSLVITFSLVPY